MSPLFHAREPDSDPTVEPVPTIFPKIDGADIAAVFEGRRVAGDFYDSIRVSPERVLFGLLDVAGRRDETRRILSAAQQIFRTVGAGLFSQLDLNESTVMTELTLRLNRGIIEASTGVRSCPAFLGCYHEKFGTLCYTNAGHTPGLLRDQAGTSLLGSTGLPLGLFSHATSDAPTVGLEKGAALVLVSCGVIECDGRNGKPADEFGLDRLKHLLQTDQAPSARDLCTSILKAAGELAPGAPLHNDRTALALIRAN